MVDSSHGIWTRCPCSLLHSGTQHGNHMKYFMTIYDKLILVDLAVAVVSDTENWV